MRDLAGALAQRRAQHLYRQRRIIDGPQGPRLHCGNATLLSFCSNDYLGLANHPELIKALHQGAEHYGVGSGASHLISGHSRAHHELEEALADFCGQPRALLFSTGYMANLGVITALATRHDNVYQDRLNHASLIDAARLSGARLQRYAHGDSVALQQLLHKQQPKDALMATDGVFSMDGDMAPLPALLDLATRYDSWLVLDEAHALGIIGTEGRGCREFFSLPDNSHRLITVGTLGKAFGTSGAFVAGSADLIETLIQQARTYIYTTALPPAIAHATLTSVKLITSEGWRREQLQTLIRRFRAGALQLALPLLDSDTPIQPLLLGDSARALQASEHLLERGLLVSAIRPPTVPQGQARLRITFSAAHQAADVDQLLDALASLKLDQPNDQPPT
jgi:8-amino-7-oxononanoate synthase